MTFTCAHPKMFTRVCQWQVSVSTLGLNPEGKLRKYPPTMMKNHTDHHLTHIEGLTYPTLHPKEARRAFMVSIHASRGEGSRRPNTGACTPARR